MVKKKQRKAALFLVICMVLSMFNGIPVQAEGYEDVELKIAWGHFDWETEEYTNANEDGEVNWCEEYASWPGDYILYIADESDNAIVDAAIEGDNGADIDSVGGGYYNVRFPVAGEYTIQSGDKSVTWRVDWPKFAFYNDAEGTEYKIDAEYTTAEGASFYIVAREDEDNPGEDDTQCTITVDSSVATYITIGDEQWQVDKEEGTSSVVMAANEEPKKVVIKSDVEGEFDINLSWPVEWEPGCDELSIHCYEKPTGLVAAWVTNFDWEDEGACGHEEDFWKSTDGCWMGFNQFYLAYLSEEGEEEPVTEVLLQYESEAQETVEAIHPGYFEFPLHKLGKYTVTYTTDDGETSKVTFKTVRPGDDVAFYRNELAEERLEGVTYQSGTPTTFYAVPNTENRSVSYKIVPQDGSDGYVTVTVDGEEVPEDEFITDEPAQVTISAEAKGGFELKVEGIVTYDGEDAEEDQEPWELASIWISEAKTGLLVSWDYDWPDDVPVLNEEPWYEKEIWTEAGGGFECYFGYRESEEEAAEPATLTLSNITYEDGTDDISTLIEIENMGAPGFYRFNFRKPGDYTITYKGSSVSVYVDMPEVGFYSAPEKTYENLMTGDKTYSFLKASKNIAANKIYLNIGGRELYDEAKHGELGWDEDTHYAFEMQLVEWDEEHDDIPRLYYGADGQPADAEGAKYKGADYLEVKSLGNSWYELQFKTGDLKVTNEDRTTWEPDTFLLCVITAEAWEDENGELIWNAWDYNGWFTGKYVALEELKIATPPTKTTYTAGETFDPTGMVVKAVYEDGTEKTVTDYTMTPSKDVKLTDANTFVRITYADGTVDLPITVKAAEIPETPATTTEATTTEATTTEALAVPDKGTPIEDEKKSDGSYTVNSSDSANPTVEYKAPKNKNAKEAKIPDTIEKDGVTYKVTSVAPNAFKGNKKVTKVTIGNNITTIGKNAFNGCKNLKTVTVGKNVTTIESGAFKGCTALTKVKIPAKTTKIGKDAFNGCKKLKTVTVGKNVTTVEANAFKGCSSLTKITLPAKTTKIGKNAFSGCKNLKTITIKSTKIKSFTKDAFNGLSKDTVIKVPKKKKAAYATLLKKAGFKGTVK